jgi:hypothetical protein
MERTTPDREQLGSLDGAADSGAGDADLPASGGSADLVRGDERSTGLAVSDLSVSDAVPALGPGDDDPRSPIKGIALPATPPPGPGDGADPHEGFEFLALPAAGPGDATTGPRQLVRFPKRT